MFLPCDLHDISVSMFFGENVGAGRAEVVVNKKIETRSFSYLK